MHFAQKIVALREGGAGEGDDMEILGEIERHGSEAYRTGAKAEEVVAETGGSVISPFYSSVHFLVLNLALF